MTKLRVLIVDPDPKSSRLLEVSLRAAGYHVAVSTRATDASRLLNELHPNIIICDTELSDLSGFDFLKSLKKQNDWRDVPFVFLSSDDTLEKKLHGLELGAEEYLAKPIYVREVITRISLILKRKTTGATEEVSDHTRFSGQLTEMGLVDLLQTMELNRKSGALAVVSSQGKAALYFRDGAVIDAILESKTLELKSAAAIFRALTWTDGKFEVNFRKVRRDDTVKQTTQALVLEGMRRLDEWNLLLAKMPPLDAFCDIHVDTLREKSNMLPDDYTRILRHIDGKTTLRQILDTAVDNRKLEPNQDPWDDLAALRLISRLFDEKVLIDTKARAPRWLVADDEDLSQVATNSQTPPPAATQTATPASTAQPATQSAHWEGSGEFRYAATLVPAKPVTPQPEARKAPGTQAKITEKHPVNPTMQTIGFENLKPQPSEAQELSFFQRAERDSNRAAKEHAALQELVKAGEVTVLPDPLGPTRRPDRRMVKNVFAGVLAATTIAVSVVAMPRIVERLQTRQPSQTPVPSTASNSSATPSDKPAPSSETESKVNMEPPGAARTVVAPSSPTKKTENTAKAAESAKPASAKENAEIPKPATPTAKATLPAAPAQTVLWKDVRRQALRALDRGQDGSAAELAKQALAVEPTLAEAWLVLGAALDSQGHHNEAQQAYTSCVKEATGSEVSECRRLVRKK